MQSQSGSLTLSYMYNKIIPFSFLISLSLIRVVVWQSVPKMSMPYNYSLFLEIVSLIHQYTFIQAGVGFSVCVFLHNFASVLVLQMLPQPHYFLFQKNMYPNNF